jgi:hypothetical protein
MRGLDPRIHRKKNFHGLMDGRVKPGHDDLFYAFRLRSLTEE